MRFCRGARDGGAGARGGARRARHDPPGPRRQGGLPPAARAAQRGDSSARARAHARRAAKQSNRNATDHATARIIRTGFGQPSVFNADLIVQELVRMGKSVVDARCGGSSGCVEVGAFGKLLAYPQ